MIRIRKTWFTEKYVANCSITGLECKRESKEKALEAIVILTDISLNNAKRELRRLTGNTQ
jgi:hypothetical protein